MSIGKRKRDLLPAEVEVDVAAPEPPSKKELRRVKKGKPLNHKPANSDDEGEKNLLSKRGAALDDGKTSASTISTPKTDIESARRDAPGVWIGNLPWTFTKTELLKYVADKGNVLPSEVTRIHMPGPTSKASSDAARYGRKCENRGFAYVDFATVEARDAVIKLSEGLIGGRALLIKDSKNFDGRPEKPTEAATEAKPPSCKIFVGNLSFEVTESDIRHHFSKCGQIKNVFVATFPDTGNCKGYAWVTFYELVSAEKAMRGWVEFEPEVGDETGEEGEPYTGQYESSLEEQPQDLDTKSSMQKTTLKRKPKPRKWFVNRLKGRELRMEYAEDATTRYLKRFGKPKLERSVDATRDVIPLERTTIEMPRELNGNVREQARRVDSLQARADGFDHARSSKKAEHSSPVTREQNKDKAYLTGAVMEGKGKKVVFG